jgi:hypothetical protein
MPIEVEINLRVPTFTVRDPMNQTRRVDNSQIRFVRRIHVESIPKVGESLPLTTRGGPPFDCTVTRADWHEQLNMFVIACKYGRSITATEHAALVADPDWTTKELL